MVHTCTYVFPLALCELTSRDVMALLQRRQLLSLLLLQRRLRLSQLLQRRLNLSQLLQQRRIRLDQLLQRRLRLSQLLLQRRLVLHFHRQHSRAQVELFFRQH